MPANKKEGKGISAIYVHAGAGFHSYQSEDLHLWVCSQAAMLAMSVLRNGGTAVDAVEVAIKFLEDHEVTNAGFGSNLSINGTVECDATIVDHLGRSGAVGAVEHVKNPISLARLVLDASTKPMTLNRVPPNLLVASGATDFAYENGMPILHADHLIARGSRDRWVKWKRDLAAAEKAANNKSDSQMGSEYQDSLGGPSCEAPVLPGQGGSVLGISPSGMSVGVHSERPSLSVPGSHGGLTPSNNSEKPRSEGASEAPNQARVNEESQRTFDHFERKGSRSFFDTVLGPSSPTTTSSATCGTGSVDAPTDDPMDTDYKPSEASSGTGGSQGTDGQDERPDSISDTVGAIAVDSYGNIAAGSSSGGIGMKHSGRTGPAALVGIGTAVIPIDPADVEGTCVATVTSGTGEHMATTLASSLCAERIYSCTRKVAGQPGIFQSVDEDTAMKSMIENEFMGHPGVKSSYCVPAIGLMTVKKTKEGIAFFFGHNTDSFALASMNSLDHEPYCLMSRNRGQGKVAQGGRYIRFNRYQSSFS